MVAVSSPDRGRRPPVRFVRIGALAFRINLRVLVMAGITLLLLVALGTWALMLGSFHLTISEVAGALTGSEASTTEFIVMDLRLPRVLAAVMVGSLLAMSGAIFQGLVRNPLVSPDVIGVNAGAALAAVYWIVNHHPLELLPIVAFLGAALAAVAVYLLSWKGNISGPRMILVGIGVNAFLTAGTTFMIVRVDIMDASRAILWTTGSVYASTWGDVRNLAIAVAVLLPVGMGLMWPLRVIQIGDHTARSVGMSLERSRLALIVVGCALSAIAVSVAGPIGFVALMVPHLARMLAGPMAGGVFLLSALIGSILVLGSDMVGQHALPVGLPVGVITAAVGAPYFLFLLYRVNTRL
jgi:iron complex transport system permease protein